MEIEVGEYVRTKSEYIAKVLGKRESHSFTTNTGHKANYQERYFVDNDRCSISKPYIKKHSKNIIDLIEVGDYVNGYRVVDIMEDMETGEIHLEMTSDYTNEIIGDCTIYNDDIKSIVTHEQFKSIEYKVKVEG